MSDPTLDAPPRRSEGSRAGPELCDTKSLNSQRAAGRGGRGLEAVAATQRPRSTNAADAAATERQHASISTQQAASASLDQAV